MNQKRLAGVSPWIIIGAVLVLAPIFLFMTRQSLDRQQAYTTKLLTEKGNALIRSFEAGARTGIGLAWGRFQLQKLLMETAQQPDIDYLIITDINGVILADSDPSLLGEIYGTDLDLKRISTSAQLQWRRVPNVEGADTFEIYRQFRPARGNDREFQGRIRSDAAQGPAEIDSNAPSGNLVIFIGLDMGPIEAARKEDNRHTIMMAVIFLLVGVSGIISLLLAQGYRSVRTSLSRIQAFSDNLVENMPIGLVAINQTGRVIVFNQTAEVILKRAAADVVGRMAADILPETCLDLIVTLEKEKRIIAREMDCPFADGRIVPLEVIATILEEEEDGRPGVIVLFRDITEVQQLKKEVARSQRLASLGSLAAGVAHEIRNPLSSIKGFATYFKERYRDDPEDGRTADIMVQEVDRLNRVISQLLDYARPMAMHRQETPIQGVLRHALRMTEAQAREKGIAIHLDLPDLPAVSIDPDRMKQVFLNLYLNALSAMENGGELFIAMVNLSGGRIRVEVRDTGVGIAPEDLGRIFDPYFTTKPSGAGLGLAIVQKIVEAHGGEIRISSAPGRGTTVTIELPTEG